MGLWLQQPLSHEYLTNWLTYLSFAPRITPSLAANFIHKWHPDALDAIDDYFGTSTRFIDYFGSNRWITSISVSHWTIRNRHGDRDGSYLEKHRQRGKFPPDNVIELGEVSSILEQYITEEHSSSLMVTGYPSGHGWILSIWSGVTDTESIASVVKDVACGVMDKFIHQQATGRCLVFLVFLGHLCNKLAIEYNKLLTELDGVMGIGNKTLLEGLEDWWGTSEAVNKLKKMLWGWEALRVFNDKLSSSLSQIQRAQDIMERYIRQHAIQQDADLIQETNNVLDDFKKRYGRLTDVHDRTQLKIKQVTGLRDGVSEINSHGWGRWPEMEMELTRHRYPPSPTSWTTRQLSNKETTCGCLRISPLHTFRWDLSL